MTDERRVCGTCKHWGVYENQSRLKDDASGECTWGPEGGFPISFTQYILREVWEPYYGTDAVGCPQYRKREDS